MKGDLMNPWLLGFVAWCAVGSFFVLWYWYEKERAILHKKLAMSALEFLIGPPLWPLAAFSAWIWRKGRLKRLVELRRNGTPLCPRHEYVLLKCENWHESYCFLCSSTRCPTCGGEAALSPRYLGRNDGGEPITEYQPIYAREL